MRDAALAMVDCMLGRKRPDRLVAFRAVVEAYPDIDPATPDFHVCMYFNHRDLEYGGAGSWS